MSKLKAFRKSTGLKQGDFARLCGFNATTYSNFENGNRHPTIKKAAVITEKLRCLGVDCTIEELFK